MRRLASILYPDSTPMTMMLLWSLGSAVCYVLAAFVMKRWDAMGNVQAAILVTAALAGAVLLETQALREAQLSYVVIIILAFEAALALLCGWILLQESYAIREAIGLVLIASGVAITRLPAAVQAT
jgi:drug/metabolite transporter (DMT)-like permease